MLRSLNTLRSRVNSLSVRRRYHGLTGGQVIYQKLLEKNVKDVFFLYRWSSNAINRLHFIKEI